MRVLLTGAAGQVAALIRPHMAASLAELVLSDLAPASPAYAGERAGQAADLGDGAAVAAVVAGAEPDALLHLGAISTEASWPQLERANVAGTRHVLAAAHSHGVARVVVASSNHVVGLYPPGRILSPGDPPWPDSLYGASKLAGEQLGRLYWDKAGLSNAHIRIGTARPAPATPRHLATWISPRDLARLCLAALRCEASGFGVYFGCSANSAGWWRDEAATALGFRPADSADSYREAIDWTAGDPADMPCQGGGFAQAGLPA